jgi:hypothetical protein
VFAVWPIQSSVTGDYTIRIRILLLFGIQLSLALSAIKTRCKLATNFDGYCCLL